MTEEQQEYTVTEWAGRPNYECTRCPFKDLSEQKMGQHIAQRHRTVRRSSVLGPKGQPIVEVAAEPIPAPPAAQEGTEGPAETKTTPQKAPSGPQEGPGDAERPSTPKGRARKES